MSFGISETGFEIKRLQDLLEENRAYAVTLFQDLIQPGEFVDTSDSSLIGRIVNFSSLADSQTWEQLQLAWSSLDPNTATGVALDNIVQYAGIERFKQSYSTAYCLFTGDKDLVVPDTMIVGFENKADTFTLTSDITLNLTAASSIVVTVNTVANTTLYSITYSTSTVSSNTVNYTSDGTATQAEILNGLKSVIDSSHPLLVASVQNNTLVVEKYDPFITSNFSLSANLSVTKVSKLGLMRADELGAITADVNELTVIKTPLIGLDSVTNPSAALVGNEIETDEELRLKFRRSKFERATNTLDAMYSALNNLSGVESVAVYENDTDVTDSNGLPPHSFMCVVLGGAADLIGDTIWTNKPAGITSHGDSSVVITDIQGFPHTIRYQTPDPVTIYVEMEIETDPTFPADGVEQIKTAIIQYAVDNYGVGEDVIYSRLYTPINSIPGHSVKSLFIDITPSPAAEDDIEIGFTEIASFSAVNITVTQL